MNSPKPYVYRAVVLSVYDGDTITCMLDMGMSVQRKVKCRLAGIDTPEIRTKSAREKKAAYIARDRLRVLVLDKEIVLQSIQKPDKYGRLLANIWVESNGAESLNDLLIREGLAIAYHGGTKVSYAMWT